MKSIFKKITLGLITSLVIMACKNETKENTPIESQNTKEMTTEAKTPDYKEIAIKAQDAFFKAYSEEGVNKYFAQDYIQHNPHVPTGIEPVLGFLPALKEANTTYKTHRLLQDGNYIIFHNTYDNAEAFGAKEIVAFDVWRMEDGKVAEHWDNITPKVNETASGRSQVDGPTEIKDLDKTEANKTLVQNLMDDVFFGKAPEKITEYISIEQYDQHNPMVKDGLSGLNEALMALAEANNPFIYKKVHKVLGEGNFVLTMSEGEWNQKPTAFYDLFRVENGKIVEHWDVIQEIPSEMAHDNGKF
ncbi:nuclear transport factor 2 family protein [Winogradskyella sp. 3972H.M.0a.05]|uniref:nuclear transport factor 2 family protein n=1 Tax=Winogradskyella sp. 3972H.M.0a.05 TaxID=2950277 RepID=UPI0033954F2C